MTTPNRTRFQGSETRRQVQNNNIKLSSKLDWTNPIQRFAWMRNKTAGSLEVKSWQWSWSRQAQHSENQHHLNRTIGYNCSRNLRRFEQLVWRHLRLTWCERSDEWLIRRSRLSSQQLECLQIKIIKKNYGHGAILSMYFFMPVLRTRKSEAVDVRDV